MRVFITGATGYIGGAVASALRRHGHEVAALVRPESDARELRDDGVFIVSSDIGSLPALRDTISQYDVLVHTAFSSSDPVGCDRTVVDVFTSTKGFIVYTSGVWALGNGESDEDSPVRPFAVSAWRPPHEQLVLATGRGAVIRPGCVYGRRQSLLAPWFAAASSGQPLQVAGDGNNHWAMVYIDDLADCYARAVNKRAGGIFHAVDDTRESMNECAKAVAGQAGLPVVHIGAEGPMAEALLADQIVSSRKTRRALGWNPMHTFTSSIEEQWREWRK